MIKWTNMQVTENSFEHPEEYQGWPEFPNDANYPRNYNDTTKPYCWSESERFAYLMSIEEYKQAVEYGSFIDYDGSGELLIYKDGDYYPLGFSTWPSVVNEIPAEATHIDWFNR